MKKPYKAFARSALTLKPLKDRVHDLFLKDFPTLHSDIPPFNDENIRLLADAVKETKKNGCLVILALGAHVLRSGVACYLIELMKQGLVDHICFNGACAIHDYELALAGATTESVARYIRTGEFGMWKETGFINDYLKSGLKKGYGFGQSLGYAMEKENLLYKEYSILYNAYLLEKPVTVHVGIGYDIIHQHPNCDGAVLGAASYQDFLIFAETVSRLDGGVYISAGSAIMGPEIFLKALSMARNAAGRKETLRKITTAVFDLYPIEAGEEKTEPAKHDFRYFFRPWKTLLIRTVNEGGRSIYINGPHHLTIPNLYRILIKE